jgi:hypothetical protein
MDGSALERIKGLHWGANDALLYVSQSLKGANVAARQKKD